MDILRRVLKQGVQVYSFAMHINMTGNQRKLKVVYVVIWRLFQEHG